MAASPLADTGFLVALLSGRDTYNKWAAAQARKYPPEWLTCEAVLSEAFHLLGRKGAASLAALLERRSLIVAFDFAREQDAVLALMRKYSEVPMSLADACLVRMTETLPNPVLLTTDSDFTFYRRHSRQAIPSIVPR
jgi:predicted nucleic acid-binding protein